MLSVSPARGVALSFQNQSRRLTERMQTSLTRLSTGRRINSGRDDPAGLISAEQLRTELTDLRAEQRGFDARQRQLSQRGSQLATVSRGLNGIRGAVVQATGDTLSEPQRRAVQLEVDATIDSFDRLAPGETPIELRDLAASGEQNLVGGDTAAAADTIETAQQSTGLEQAAVAAEQRALDYERRANEDQQVIVTRSLSLTEDADFAEVTSNLITTGILARASNLALAFSQRSHADLIGSLLDRVGS